jgi:hypothetical protein
MEVSDQVHALFIHQIGVCVRPRVGLSAVAERKFSTLSTNRNSIPEISANMSKIKDWPGQGGLRYPFSTEISIFYIRFFGSTAVLIFPLYRYIETSSPHVLESCSLTRNHE